MQKQLKHTKYKNTGILFELLVRQITSDIMYNKESKAISILKKFFNSTSELSKELVLYKMVLESTNISEFKSGIIIETILDQSNKLNHSKLSKEKYNLIKAIKSNYDLNEFFKAKIKSYKPLASTYVLIEANRGNNNYDPKFLVNNRMTLLEHMCSKDLIDNSFETQFLKEDKEIRLLTYRILVEKFNTQYSTLSHSQKAVLREYINNISNNDKLKEYLNLKLTEVKKSLKEILPTISDKVTSIKIAEIYKNINLIDNKAPIKDDQFITLMKYYDLIKELKSN